MGNGNRRKYVRTPVSEIKVGQHIGWFGVWCEVIEIQQTRVMIIDGFSLEKISVDFDDVIQGFIVKENQPIE